MGIDGKSLYAMLFFFISRELSMSPAKFKVLQHELDQAHSVVQHSLKS